MNQMLCETAGGVILLVGYGLGFGSAGAMWLWFAARGLRAPTTKDDG